jgi:hypothetical protein
MFVLQIVKLTMKAVLRCVDGTTIRKCSPTDFETRQAASFSAMQRRVRIKTRTSNIPPL